MHNNNIYIMPRFHQTVLPLEKMMPIWFKLSIMFALVTFIESLIHVGNMKDQNINKWVNTSMSYDNWTNTAVCDTSKISKVIHEYPQLAEATFFSMIYLMLGCLRSAVNIIIPYYFTTFVISMYTA